MDVRNPETVQDTAISTTNSAGQTLDLRLIPKPANPNPNPGPEMIRYRECQKNHAAHLGGHVVDGCGEFMPAADDGTPLSLKCAACDCHRNFHRREADGGESTSAAAPPYLLPPPPHTAANCYISFNTANNTTPRPQKHPVVRPLATHALTHNNHHQISSNNHQSRPPVMMTFGRGAAAESSSEDLNAYQAAAAEQYGSSKKRFRTKFTQEQKEKMVEFAEKIEWRIHKQVDSEVHQFCAEMGIKRQVFKVWLHNNKQTNKRKLP